MKKVITLFIIILSFPGLKLSAQTCNITPEYSYQSDSIITNRLSFTNLTTGVDTTATAYWDFGDGSSSNLWNTTHSYVDSGTYHVCLTVYKNSLCNSTTCKYITVIVTPCNLHTDYSWQADSMVPNKIIFTNISAGVLPNATAYWHFGDGTSSEAWDSSHVFPGAGVYHVCLMVYNNYGCYEGICKDIMIGGPCTVLSKFTLIKDSLGVRTYFYNTSTGIIPNSTALWNFGDGNTSTDWSPYHIYTQPGTYHICLTVYNDSLCSNTTCRDTTISSVSCSLIVNYSQHADSIIYNKIYFNNQSTGTTQNSTVYWDFGDGTSSTQWSPNHTFQWEGTYHVCLAVYNDTLCNNSLCQDITVILTPCNLIVNYYEQADSIIYNRIYFNNQSTGTVAGATAYWDFGDGTSSTQWSPNHIFTPGSTYYACLTVQNDSSCTQTTCHYVTVNALSCNLTSNFSYHADSTITNSILFTNLSTGADSTATAYWDFGDGSASDSWNTNHYFTDSGTYHVCLTVSNDSLCNSTTCHDITVVVTPCNLVTDYSWSVDSITANRLIFTNISSGVSSHASSYWDYGDGSISAAWDSSHVFPGAGVYHVCLTVYNNPDCYQQVCKDITIGGPCNLSANFSSFSDSALNTLIYFNNLSAGAIASTTAFWDFGDGTTSTEWYPNHTYAQSGYYNVCLTVSNGASCSSTICNNISLNIRMGSNIVIYPNPASSQINMMVPLGQSETIYAYIYNSMGFLVQQVNRQGIAGSNNLLINIGSFSTGVYRVRIIHGGQTYTTSFIKL